MKQRISYLISALFLSFAFFTTQCDSNNGHPKDGRPNIVIILADDMGFSDIGSFGSEINTPNMDALAGEGIRFTQFYTHASCSPTRSMILSGIDNHLNGLGNMGEWTAPNQMNVVGYEGDLNHKVITIPQALKQVGYHTYMVGKWHMGKEPEKIPRARGFERDFSLLDGGGSYWDLTNLTANIPKSLFTEDGKYLRELPQDYYATKTYTDKLIEFIDSNKGDDQPFFAYVSHQAPHDPYHLPKEWRNQYSGAYNEGWDSIRLKRLENQIELGILPTGTRLSDRLKFVQSAESMDSVTRTFMGRKMELYAGMMENLDYHIGRLVDYLKETGEYENTLFIVFGDNGAEGNDLLAMIAGNPKSPNYKFFEENWSKDDPEELGDPGSFPAYGPGWAQVSMTPFDQFKGFMAEGGIRNSLIVCGAGIKREKGSINQSIMHVIDIMPTLLEIAGAEYPEKVEGSSLPTLYGKSWIPMLRNETEFVRSEEDYLAWEIFGNRALRQGNWKIRWQWKPMGTETWELYNLNTDPAESYNLATQFPEKVEVLLSLWEEYVRINNVIIPDKSVFTMDRNQATDPDQEIVWPPLIYQKQFEPPEDMFKELNENIVH